MDKARAIVIMVVSALMSWMGILAVPVFLMLSANVIDYMTGLLAAAKRKEAVSSYRSIWGIAKKICMWLLVVVGALLDVLINYAAECAGLEITIPFVVATVVAVWLVVNEIISILENMIDIGAHIPPFLLPIVKYLKRQVEEKASVTDEEDPGEPEERDCQPGSRYTDAARSSGEAEGRDGDRND